MPGETQTRVGALVLFIVLLGGILWFLKTPLLPAVSPAPQTGTPSVTVEPNIVVFSPKPGDKVSNPIHITGKARVFEAVYQYQLLNSAGTILYKGTAMTTGASVPDYGDIDVQVPVPYTDPELVAGTGSPLNLTLEVFEYSAKDGSVVNLVSVPLELASSEAAEVKVYLASNKLDPAITCEKVFPVKRTIYKTQQVGFAALHELLRKLPENEKTAGYSTLVPESFRLNSLTIENGTAFADFQNWGEIPAGSCRVGMIRAQIENTLLQFPSVKTVVISVNGRTEDALQP